MPRLPAHENPFRVARLEAISYRAAGHCWERLLDVLRASEWRGAIVGPQGSGKTTLFDELARRIDAMSPDIKVHHLPVLREDEPPWSFNRLKELTADICAHHVVFFDGADHLPRPTWWLLRWRVKHARGFVVTTHSPGLLPTLVRTSTSPALLDDLVAELLGEIPASIQDRLEELHGRHNGDIRAALFELYDIYGGRSTLR